MSLPRGALVGASVLAVVGTLVAAPAAADTSGVVVDSSVAPPPPVLARAWVVVDAETGAIVAAKNPHRRLRPASTLKTLTAVTLLPRLDLRDVYRVQWEDAHVIGSAVGLVPGSRYTIDQLFYGLMLPSGNDAARALARAAGGVPSTVAAMNAKARRLGAHDTHAVNPTGLDAPGQLSSVFDLAVFARTGLADRDFRRYVSTVSTEFPAEEPRRDIRRKTYMIYNQNPLLLSGYRGTIGVKTGYTTLAGRTFVGAAERDGQTLIVALMGIIEPSGDAARRLLDWGFAHAEDAAPVGSLERPQVPLVAQRADPPISVPLADPATTPQAASAASGAASAGDLTGDDRSIAGWAVAGLVLMLGGWLLQRRRPADGRR